MRPGTWEALDEELGRRRSEAEAQVAVSLSEERYPALRTVVSVFKLFAVLSLVAGTIIAFVIFRESVLGAIAAVFAGVWLAITYWASGELISLFIDIEANTRALRHPLRTLT
jgi:hypothetical protein